MKNVRLKKLILVNFKGARHLEIDFSDVTNIFGDNGTGKTRNFTAFIWLLFGKDEFDRKDHEILNIENGKVVDRAEAEVGGILDVDGEEISLRRIYRQVWQRKKGEQYERMTKHESLYYCNDVPLKAAEYKAKVDSIIDETVFKLITNPTFFLGLKWEKQREHLFQMAGTITDNQIAAMKPEFRAFLDSLSGKSFEDHKKTVNARKKKLEEDLAEINPRIDQVRKMMPENKDFDALAEELKKVEAEIIDIDTLISDKSAAVRKQYEGIQATQKEIGTLRSQQQAIVQKANEKAQNDAFEKNSSRRTLEDNLDAEKNNLSKAQRTQREIESDIQTLNKKIQSTDGNMAELREKFTLENAKEYQAKEGCLVCPVFGVNCGDEEVKKKHAEAGQKAKDAFNEKKIGILNGINEEGGELAKLLKTYQEELSQKEKDLEAAKQSVSSIQMKVDELQKELEGTKVVSPAEVIPQDLEEWTNIEAQIKAKEATIEEVKPVDNVELAEKKKGLEIRRDQLKEEIGKKYTIASYNSTILRLEDEGKKLSQQIADLEKDIFLIEDFSKTKIKECESRINGLFKLVSFQLFNTTIENKDDEDKVFEVCIAKNKSGVPINATNTAERVNAGLDIINALCRFHNVTAPIFIDGRESVNDLIPTESQIINLVVTKDKELKFSQSNG